MSESLWREAQSFFRACAEDERNAVGLRDENQFTERMRAVKKEIKATGTYTHTFEELQYGAQLAWRNSNRCIGRHVWRSLQVRDARDVNSVEEVHDHLISHIQTAFNGGKIRSFITIFPARNLGNPDEVRIANHQLIRYAGFKDEQLGDPATISFTNRVIQRGWHPQNRGAFTPLPWEIHWRGETGVPFDVFQKHPELLHEVPIAHPEYPDVQKEQWKWYALPLLSELALKIGGIVYPCAPFNGYYMGTEIGARNLADQNRYNLLPRMAKIIGLDTRNDRTLWRDRALVELNRAVLYSFDAAGVTLGDHHGLGRAFEKFCEAEQDKGKAVTGDWSWLNPPMSSPQTPQFHREFDNHVETHTNFFYQPGPGDLHQSYFKPSPQNCPFHLPGNQGFTES